MSEKLVESLWNRRSMIWAIAVNDLKLRYKHSLLGFFWTFLEPILLLAVMYVVFTNIFKNNIENYPLYLLLGLILWYNIERGTNLGIQSLLAKAGIIQKIYFRRELLIISANITVFIMMFFELIAFSVFMAIFGIIPPIEVIFFPLVLILLFCLTLGISLILGPINVYYRDIQPIWHVVLRGGFFLTPLFYTLDIFPEDIQSLLKLNPMVGIMDLSRAFTIHAPLPATGEIIYSITVSIGILFLGFFVFKKFDKRLVEEL